MAKQKDNKKITRKTSSLFFAKRHYVCLGDQYTKSYFNRQDLIVFVSGEIRRIISIGAKNVSYIWKTFKMIFSKSIGVLRNLWLLELYFHLFAMSTDHVWWRFNLALHAFKMKRCLILGLQFNWLGAYNITVLFLLILISLQHFTCLQAHNGTRRSHRLKNSCSAQIFATWLGIM